MILGLAFNAFKFSVATVLLLKLNAPRVFAPNDVGLRQKIVDHRFAERKIFVGQNRCRDQQQRRSGAGQHNRQQFSLYGNRAQRSVAGLLFSGSSSFS